MNNKLNIAKMVMAVGFFLSAACNKSVDSFSLLPASQSFVQSTPTTVNNKIDILWVIDVSFSMDPLQQSLVSNFTSFINGFIGKGYDFHIGVTTSDAYLSGAKFYNNLSYSKLKDGVGTTHTGVFVIDQNTPNLVNTFVTNALQGQNGGGDERVFSSFRNTLSNSQNSGFLRPDAFLAVIIVSDEDDFSGDNRPVYGGKDHDYAASTLDSVDTYVSFLDTLKATKDINNRKFSVSSIAVLDSACLTIHKADASSSIIGQRYMSLSQKTNGVLGSICNDFAQTLLSIQSRILELSSQFELDRQPVVSTIVVVVNGVSVPQDASNGWTYNSSNNSIVFHGTAIPAQGSTISVNFDPLNVTL